jgi:phosphatidylglycerophosphatase A
MASLVASFFGTGRILGWIRGEDIGSGTVGGLAASILALWIGTQSHWVWVAVGALVLFGAGLWAAGAVDSGDAGWIVIDEATGAFVALIGVTAIPAAVAAFVVFRLADIAKRRFPGVDAAEGLPGAPGIMMDDVVAGLYGLAVGHIVQWLY